MPGLLPKCVNFNEVGVKLLAGDEIQRLMAVSPDGLVKCNSMSDHECQDVNGDDFKPIAIEIKCPLRDDETIVPVHYTIPAYYICQVLSEMYALDCRKLWFLSYSKSSTTLCTLEFDFNMWLDLWCLAEELYGDPKPKRPVGLHPIAKHLRSVIKEFARQNSKFIMEVPSIELSEQYESWTSDVYNEAYMRSKQRVIEDHDDMAINVELCAILKRCTTALLRAQHLERRKATELMFFVLSDTDRGINDKKTSTIPIAYGLKGKSLNGETLRKMLLDVRVSQA